MAEKAKKNGKLFLLIGGILAAFVIVLNIIQITIVARVSRQDIEESASQQYQQMAQQTAQVYGNFAHSYIHSVEFYTKSDVVVNGASTEEIVEWMKSVVDRRDEDFEYVGFVDLNGKNYTDTGSTSNVADRPYYQAIVVKGEEEYIGNPVIARATGRNVIHVCQAAVCNGKTVGLFYGILDPEMISEELKNIELGEDSFVTIFGNDGTLVGSSVDSEIIMQDLMTMQNSYPESYEKINQGMKSLSTFSVTGTSGAGEEIIIFGEKVPHTSWEIMYVLDEHLVYKTANIVTKLMIAGGVILALLIILVVSIIVFRSLKPLTVVETTIRGIATGDADLTRRIDLHANNEIGRVVEGFNLFSEKLQAIIATMKHSKEDLLNAGQLLQDSTEDTSAAITQIIGNIESMGKQVNYQTESVHQTAGAVNQIASNIESLNRMIESQSSAVTQASAAVEEMIGNINSVNNSVQKMGKAFEELEQKAIVGVQKQNDVNAKIDEIEKESQALQEANAVISGIAEQTNLLAMNAAIEAAHAGEAGKGFSVVADEIRKLSEDSGAQSQTIGNQLSKITGSIESIVEASQIATDAFNEVSAGINSTTNLVREITNAMMEQNEGSKQIVEARNDGTERRF